MTKRLELQIDGEQAMVAFGERLGCALKAGVIFLQGGLGAGKTTLCRGILRSRGYSGAVKSPTYTLVEPYQLAGQSLFHFDLYRLRDPEELEYMGIRDYFDAGNLCIIEWPEMGQGLLPAADVQVEIAVCGEGRTVSIMAVTAAGNVALAELAESKTDGSKAH